MNYSVAMTFKPLLYLLSFSLLTSACTETETKSVENITQQKVGEFLTDSSNRNSGVNEKARQKRLSLEKKYQTNSGSLIKINDIVGKTLKQTEKLLGKATNIDKARPSGTPCKTNGGCDKAQFQAGKYEILFINGKADWITINELFGFDLDESSIQLLGLPKSAPNVNSASLIRWVNVKGIKEITFFKNGSDKIDYIYIKAKTE